MASAEAQVSRTAVCVIETLTTMLDALLASAVAVIEKDTLFHCVSEQIGQGQKWDGLVMERANFSPGRFAPARRRTLTPAHRRTLERATTLSSQTTRQRAGSVHLVEKLPFSSSTFKTIHVEQAGKRDHGGSPVGARHIVREHNTTCIKQGYKTRARSLLTRGCSGSRFFCVVERSPGEKIARSITSPS
jgi:hypothetical protein